MNSRFFKLIFSRRLRALVAVGENCSSEGKSTSASLLSSIFTDFSDKNINLSTRFAGVLALGFIWVASAFADPATNALPVGGSVAQGSASIAQQANQMVINQITDKAVINWQGFDIGAAASINVLQPNSSSVLLNRVVGNNPSQIFGSLNANGHVILVNPNGIAFGADGSVTASAFTASTLGISDADFMAGNYRFVANGLAGSILNQGSINATNGYVALLGANVTNDGKITTNQGNVYMGAAQSIAVPVSNSGRIKMELDPASVNAAVNNTHNGVIVTSGGQVLMQASAVNDAMATASITHAGQINTTATQAGNVSLLADGGNIRVSGSIVANSTNSANQGGDIIIGRDLVTGALAKTADVSGANLLSGGGFVETSGGHLITDGVFVKASQWLLDPTDIAITTADSGVTSSGTNPITQSPNTSGTTTSTVNATTLASTLGNGTSVVIRTTNASGAGNGDITVASNVSVTNSNGDATLTLQAERNITVNGNIKIERTGSNKLNVILNADSDGTGGGAIVMNKGSQVLSNGGNINMGGGVAGNGSGYAQGNSGHGVSLLGTTLNAGAGNVFIKGQSSSANGVNFFNDNSITAATYDIRGQSSTSNGVHINNGGNTGPNWYFTTNLTSTSGDSILEGISTSDRGLFVYANNVININSGIGIAAIRSADGEMRIGFSGGVTINTNGNVTLGSKLSNRTNFFLQGTIKAQSGSLTILGKSTSSNAIALQDGGGVASRLIGTNGAQITLDGESGSAVGVHLQPSGVANSITASGAGASISITGVSATSSGVFTGGTSITNSNGSITLNGTSNGSSGLGINSNGSAAISASGNLTMIGSAVGNNAIYLTGITTSTGGSVSLTGTTSTSTALNLQGNITANSNLVISGSNTSASNSNATVYLNKVATATTGTIGITTDTSGSTLIGLQLGSGAALNTTNKAITLTTDSLSIDTAGANIGAGTGIVTIQNNRPGVSVNIGASDVGNVTSTSRTLGLTNAELNRISAGSLVIGSNSAGNILISAATTTNATTGHLTLRTNGSITNNAALTVGGATSSNNLILNATASIEQNNNGLFSANNLSITTSANIGSSINRIQTNVNNLSLNAIGSVFLTEANALTLAANTGTLDVATTNGTLVVGAVNSIVGITSTGNVSLSATNSAGSGIYIGQNITAQNGNVNITGTTSSASNFNYGVQSAAIVSAKNITMLASATSTTGTVLGYYGAGGVFNASEQLNLTGISSNAGNGFYTYTGGFSSGTGMAITGTSALGQGVGLDNQITLTNGSVGGINVTGTATDASKQGIGLRGTAFNNAGGNTVITALSGNIFTSSGNLAWNTGVHTNTLTQGGTGSVQVSAGNGSATNSASIDGSVFSITQNNNAGVSVSTSGTGNLIAPKIVNGGSGDVVVAAGSSIAAGTGSGGQVLTLNGNNITNSSGKTYIYTGQASATGVLSNLDSSFNLLYYQGASHTLNAAFNQAYNSTITGGANAQVFFREATLPNFNLTLPAVTLTKTYGATDPTISDVIAAVQTAYTGPSVLSTSVAGVGGSNTFAFSATEAINSLSGLRAAGNNASITPYAYTLSSVLNTTVTGAQPGLRIDKAGLVAAIDSITTTYGTVVPLTAQFSGFAYGENAAGVGISLAGLTSAGYTGNTTTNNVQNGGYAITAASLANQNSTANYYISSISNGTLTINPATISVIANNASKLVTRSDPALTYSYSGLVNGDSSSIFSAPTLSRQIGESAGPYAITATGANAGSNYTVQYTPGVFTIAGVQKVLIQMSNVSTVYGTTVNPSIQSVEYINNSSVIFTLSRVANTNTWTDGVGGLITITPTLATATTNAGIYQNVVTNTNNGTATSSGNFNGVMTQTANVTIAPKVASINIVDVNRTYDGSAFTALQASASTSDLVNGDTIASLGGLSYLGSAIGSTAAGTYTIGANLTNPAAASNYSMTINSGTLTTRPVVVPTPAKEDKPFVNPVAPKPVTPAESGSKSQVSSSTTAQAVDVKLAVVEKPSVTEQCSATAGRSEKCDCQKTLFDEVLLCKVPLEGAGQPAHATQKAKAHSNFN